jgi:hypothetical protein
MPEVLEKVIERKFSIKEAAAALGNVSQWAIRAEIRRGKLGHYRMTGEGKGKAGRLLIGAGHLAAYLDRFEVKAV